MRRKPSSTQTSDPTPTPTPTQIPTQILTHLIYRMSYFVVKPVKTQSLRTLHLVGASFLLPWLSQWRL